jgi:hypothetical protein
MKKSLLQSIFILLALLLFFNTNILGQDNYVFSYAGSRVCFNVNDDAALDLTGDFTIEAWVYPTAASTFYIAERPDVFRFYIFNSGGPVVRFDTGAGATISISSPVLTLNTWNHVAVSRTDTVTTFYTNGIAGSNANIPIAASNVGVNIGAASSWSSGSVLNMFDEVRYSNIGRYTADFTITTAQAWLGSDANTVFYFTFSNNTLLPPADESPLALATSNGPTTGTAGMMTLDNYVLDNTLLPVELTKFAAVVNGNSVVLEWETATELNNYGFEIERSADDQSFEKIGFVEGNINSSTAKSYSFSDKINSAGNYFYRLKQIDLNGTFEYSNTIEVSTITPEDYSISQNYPNPFNPSTTIEFKLPQQSNVNIKVYNTIGEVVAVLLNDNVEAGNHTVSFDASNLPSGIYIYRIETENFSQSMKMTLLK